MAEKPIKNGQNEHEPSAKEDSGLIQPNNSQKSLFDDPLPTWLVWPLDSKLPMVPGPQNVQLYTTKLGEKIVQSYPELDFNLYDPNAYDTPIEYEALHDPHLHKLFESRHFRDHLVKRGFITEDGKVLCSLKEFNKYRAYLNSLYQQLEKKESAEALGKPHPEHSRCGCRERPALKRYSARKQNFHKIRAKIQKRRQLEKMASDMGISILDIDSDIKEADNEKFKERNERIRQVQERMKNKQKMDRVRLQKRLEDDNEKRLKLRNEKEQLLAERERLQQEQFQAKLSDMKDRQFLDRQRKLEKIKQHLAHCDFRYELLANQRQAGLKERQEKLKKLWELRKAYQMKRLISNEIKDAEAEAKRKNKIEQRRRSVQQQQQHHENALKESAEKARQRRMQVEEEYKRKLKKRQDAITAAHGTRGSQMKDKYDKGDGPVPPSTTPQTSFDLTESLLNFMKMMDEEEETIAQPYPDGEIDYSKRVKGVDPVTMKIYSRLPVPDLLPSDWTPRGTPRHGWWNNYGLGIPKYELVTSTFDSELATKTPESIEEAAAKYIQMVTFLASEVVYPAILRAEYEEIREAEIEKRRKQKEEYERREEERKRREEERKARAKLLEKRRAELLQRKREEEQKKAEARKIVTPKKPITAGKVAKTLLAGKADKRKKDVKKDTKKVGGRRKSSVRFNLASTVDIPVELPVVLTPPMESVTPDLQDSVESELMHLHECEDDDDDTEDLGGHKVEANDSLTLLRRSKTKITTDVKPTKFASLLAVEILDTLQNVLVKPEDIIVPATSQDTSAAEKKSDTDKEEKSKDLDDLHVTPLAKILVEQAVTTVAQKLGIDIQIERKVSDTSHHYVPKKKSIGVVKTLKDIDYKTPATVLMLAVLEAAAKQTGTPFDKSLYVQKQETPVKKISKTKKSCLEAAASAYGTSSKATTKTGKQPVKAGSVSKLKPSKETGITDKKSKDLIPKGLKPIAHESGAISETFHVVKESTETVLRRDKTVSSPHLFGEHVVTSLTPEKQEPQSREPDFRETDKETGASEQTADQVTTEDTVEIHKDTKGDENEKIAEPEETDLPKKRSSFFARVSSFLLSKRGSSKSGSSDKESKTKTDADLGKPTGEAEDEKETETPLSTSKSEDSKLGIIKPTAQTSSPQLTESSIEKVTPTRSIELINHLVKAQISRILYNAKIEYAKEMGVEIQHKDRKVISDTKVLQEIVQKQVSEVLHKGKTGKVGETAVTNQDSKKPSDTQIIESIVNDQIHGILSERNLQAELQKSRESSEVIVKESTPAFASIAKAYSSEMNVNIDDLDVHSKATEGMEALQTQHPIHLAILKKIASKIEKEEEIKNKKGLENYRRIMSSMLRLDLKEDKVSQAFLQTVGERYKYSLREDPAKCKADTEIEAVLKNNLITTINLIREGIMPNSELIDLIGAVVASYLIAHSMLPLAEDTSSEHSSFAQYKGMEVGNWLSTPVLIDTLIAEILHNVKQNLRVGTFNAVHVIMAVYGMHRKSIEVAEKKEAETLSKQPSAPSIESSSDEEIIAVSEAADADVEFVPMFKDHPLGLDKEEASFALVALSVKDPDQIDCGTDAVERNSFYSLVKPDVSRLKTFCEADKTVTDEAARKHLSAVSMQFKKRSETKFGPAAQAAMRGTINYEKLKRGSLPVMGSMKAPEKVMEESDESDEDETKEKARNRLRSQSIAIGMNMDKVLKVTDPALKAASTGAKPKSVSHTKITASDESVVKAEKSEGKSKSSIQSQSSGASSKVIQIIGSQSLGSDEEPEVPPEDPELVRLSARREQRAQQRAAEKQRHARSSEELKEKSPISSQKSSLHSSVASPRTSYGSVGSGLKPRPSSAFKSEKVSSFQEVEQQKQIGVQTSDLLKHDVSFPDVDQQKQVGVQTSDFASVCPTRDQDVQVTGNEAAVQTSSSIRQYGRQGSSQVVGSDTLALLTPLTVSENWEYEYSRHPKTPDPGETTSADAVNTAKVGSYESIVSLQARSEDGTSKMSHGRPSSVHEKRTTTKERTAGYESAEKVVRTDKPVPEEAIKILIHSHQELARGVPETAPQVQSAGSIQQKQSPVKDRETGSSKTLVEEIVEYEEITELSSSPQPKTKRRMSFVPNFATPVPVIGAFGQENRRMSYFPGFEQKEEGTRSVLEDIMDPELPTSQTNRDNFIMDEDDDVQDVSPLVSNASVSTGEENRQGSGTTKSGTSKSSVSRKESQRRGSRSSNKSNNNTSLPQPTVKNSNNNSANRNHHEAKKKIRGPSSAVVSPYKTDNTLLKRLHIGSRTLTMKAKPKDEHT